MMLFLLLRNEDLPSPRRSLRFVHAVKTERTPWGGGKKRGEENLTNDTPPKRGFGPPLVRYVFHPLRCQCSGLPIQESTTEQTRRSFRGVPKIFGRARSLVRFPPPMRFAPPPPHIIAQKELCVATFSGLRVRPSTLNNCKWCPQACPDSRRRVSFCGHDTVAVASHFAMKMVKFASHCGKFLAIFSAIQKLDRDCGCDAAVHSAVDVIANALSHPFRRPLKTTFDMTTFIFSAGGCPSYPFIPLKGVPGTLFRASERKPFQGSRH